MRLSRKNAIKLCIEVWTWCAETGKPKEDWPEWDKYGDIDNDCWFCEYDEQQKKKKRLQSCCGDCPLKIKLGHYCSKTAFGYWVKVETIEDRKKYTKLFLAQIKTLV